MRNFLTLRKYSGSRLFVSSSLPNQLYSMSEQVVQEESNWALKKKTFEPVKPSFWRTDDGYLIVCAPHGALPNTRTDVSGVFTYSLSARSAVSRKVSPSLHLLSGSFQTFLSFSCTTNSKCLSSFRLVDFWSPLKSSASLQ